MAATATIGILRAMLTADTAQFDAGMKRAGATTDKFKKSQNDLGTSLKSLNGVLGLFGAALSVGALVGFTKSAFEAGSKIQDLANKTGLSTDTIQRFQFVAEQTGGTVDGFTDAAFRLQTRLAGGSASVIGALRDLSKESGRAGLTTKSSAEEIISALSAVSDQQERTRLGTELFGRSFASIAAAVAEGYDNLAAQAPKLSAKQIKALDDAGDAWGRFKANAVIAMQGVIAEGTLFFDWWTKNLASAQFQKGALPEGALMSGFTPDSIRQTQDYVAALKKVNEELSKLTPAQREQIAAAQKLGEDLGVLEDNFGLSSGALKILTSNTKENTSELKKNEAQALKNARAFEETERAWRDFVNEIGVREIEEATEALKRLEDADRAYRQFRNDVGMREIEDAEDIARAKEQAEREWRQFQNEIGLRTMEEDAARIQSNAELYRGELVNNVAATLDALSQIRSKSKALAIAAKAGAIAAATMNTYEGATKALAKLPPPFNFAAAAAVIAAGLAQVAIIVKQPVGYREGTPGLDFQNFGARTPTELHGDEAVIPRGRGHLLADEIARSLRRFGPPAAIAPQTLQMGSGGGFLPRVIQSVTRPIQISATFTSLDPRTSARIFREEFIPEFKSMLMNDTDGLGAAIESSSRTFQKAR